MTLGYIPYKTSKEIIAEKKAKISQTRKHRQKRQKLMMVQSYLQPLTEIPIQRLDSRQKSRTPGAGSMKRWSAAGQHSPSLTPKRDSSLVQNFSKLAYTDPRDNNHPVLIEPNKKSRSYIPKPTMSASMPLAHKSVIPKKRTESEEPAVASSKPILIVQPTPSHPVMDHNTFLNSENDIIETIQSVPSFPAINDQPVEHTSARRMLINFDSGEDERQSEKKKHFHAVPRVTSPKRSAPRHNQKLDILRAFGNQVNDSNTNHIKRKKGSQTDLSSSEAKSPKEKEQESESDEIASEKLKEIESDHPGDEGGDEMSESGQPKRIKRSLNPEPSKRRHPARRTKGNAHRRTTRQKKRSKRNKGKDGGYPNDGANLGYDVGDDDLSFSSDQSTSSTQLSLFSSSTSSSSPSKVPRSKHSLVSDRSRPITSSNRKSNSRDNHSMSQHSTISSNNVGYPRPSSTPQYEFTSETSQHSKRVHTKQVNQTRRRSASVDTLTTGMMSDLILTPSPTPISRSHRLAMTSQTIRYQRNLAILNGMSGGKAEEKHASALSHSSPERSVSGEQKRHNSGKFSSPLDIYTPPAPSSPHSHPYLFSITPTPISDTFKTSGSSITQSANLFSHQLNPILPHTHQSLSGGVRHSPGMNGPSAPRPPLSGSSPRQPGTGQPSPYPSPGSVYHSSSPLIASQTPPAPPFVRPHSASLAFHLDRRVKVKDTLVRVEALTPPPDAHKNASLPLVSPDLALPDILGVNSLASSTTRSEHSDVEVSHVTTPLLIPSPEHAEAPESIGFESLLISSKIQKSDNKPPEVEVQDPNQVQAVPADAEAVEASSPPDPILVGALNTPVNHPYESPLLADPVGGDVDEMLEIQIPSVPPDIPTQISIGHQFTSLSPSSPVSISHTSSSSEVQLLYATGEGQRRHNNDSDTSTSGVDYSDWPQSSDSDWSQTVFGRLKITSPKTRDGKKRKGALKKTRKRGSSGSLRSTSSSSHFGSVPTAGIQSRRKLYSTTPISQHESPIVSPQDGFDATSSSSSTTVSDSDVSEIEKEHRREQLWTEISDEMLFSLFLKWLNAQRTELQFKPPTAPVQRQVSISSLSRWTTSSRQSPNRTVSSRKDHDPSRIIKKDDVDWIHSPFSLFFSRANRLSLFHPLHAHIPALISQRGGKNTTNSTSVLEKSIIIPKEKIDTRFEEDIEKDKLNKWKETRRKKEGGLERAGVSYGLLLYTPRIIPTELEERRYIRTDLLSGQPITLRSRSMFIDTPFTQQISLSNANEMRDEVPPQTPQPNTAFETFPSYSIQPITTLSSSTLSFVSNSVTVLHRAPKKEVEPAFHANHPHISRTLTLKRIQKSRLRIARTVKQLDASTVALAMYYFDCLLERRHLAEYGWSGGVLTDSTQTLGSVGGEKLDGEREKRRESEHNDVGLMSFGDVDLRQAQRYPPQSYDTSQQSSNLLPSPVTKANIKTVAAVCTILAIKFNEETKETIKRGISSILSHFKCTLQALLSVEMSVYVALQFNLLQPAMEVSRYYPLIFRLIEKVPVEYFGLDLSSQYFVLDEFKEIPRT
ncbi:hypothetical protein BLNAU_16904 [Blattamonas nauphoetae]|uniref:Uncharacterized protein n=1 Tax=Blattamonas nauphoetae TaxID=2049346 RepID=A0ABQ9XAE3_9EUKA|nr:hypothetical protein BLNAU_16904 [Blattamonas nauphoetae]